MFARTTIRSRLLMRTVGWPQNCLRWTAGHATNCTVPSNDGIVRLLYLLPRTSHRLGKRCGRGEHGPQSCMPHLINFLQVKRRCGAYTRANSPGLRPLRTFRRTPICATTTIRAILSDLGTKSPHGLRSRSVLREYKDARTSSPTLQPSQPRHCSFLRVTGIYLLSFPLSPWASFSFSLPLSFSCSPPRTARQLLSVRSPT